MGTKRPVTIDGVGVAFKNCGSEKRKPQTASFIFTCHLLENNSISGSIPHIVSKAQQILDLLRDQVHQ
jgi:hypothetical protein